MLSVLVRVRVHGRGSQKYAALVMFVRAFWFVHMHASKLERK